MSRPSVLYVIGNGFDLHHGLATGFSDFKQFVKAEQPDITDKMDKHLSGLDENWCNLKKALAYFDVDTLIDHAGLRCRSCMVRSSQKLCTHTGHCLTQ